MNDSIKISRAVGFGAKHVHHAINKICLLPLEVSVFLFQINRCLIEKRLVVRLVKTGGTKRSDVVPRHRYDVGAKDRSQQVGRSHHVGRARCHHTHGVVGS